MSRSGTAPERRVSVVVGDDHPVYRDGLRALAARRAPRTGPAGAPIE